MTKIVSNANGSLAPVAKQSRPKRSFWFGITNLEWISLKALYFFQYGALGALIPYIILFYGTRGLDASQIGIIELVFTFIGSISRPIFGTIADKTAKHRLVLGISILVFTIMFFALTFIHPSASPVVRYPLSLRCNATTHDFEFEACQSAEAILANTSSIQPDVMLHHSDSGFQDNCSSVGFRCQIVCRNFVPIRSEKGIVSIEPFVSLGLQIFTNQSTSELTRCSVFPLRVSSSHDYVSLACNNTQLMPCEIDCGCSANKTDIDPNSYVAAAKEQTISDNRRIFFTALMLRSIGAIPFGPSISLADSITYDVLGPASRSLWGQQRMFGTLAWGTVAGILGPLIDKFGNFDSVFYCFGVFGVSATLIALFWLPKHMPHHSGAHQSHDSTKSSNKRPKALPFSVAMRSVFKMPLFCISCGVAVFSGMFLGVLYVPWPMLMIKDLGAPKLLIGVAAALACGLEIPGLFFAGAVVNHLGEPICFLLMFAAYAIRFLCYAYLTPSVVWLALLLEILHIFCFAFYFTAATRFAATIAPPGTSATVQAILHASYFGIGLGLGNLASSLLYQIYGGHIAFLIYAAFAAFLFIVLLILYFTYLRKEFNRIKTHPPERIGSFSPTLHPEASYVDEDDDVDSKPNSPKNLPEPSAPLITSASHPSEL